MGGSGVQGQPLLRKFEARLGYMKIMGKKFFKKMPPPTFKVYKNLPLKMDPKRLGCNSCLLFTKIPIQVPRGQASHSRMYPLLIHAYFLRYPEGNHMVNV